MLFQKIVWNQPTEAFQVQETEQERLIHKKTVSPLLVQKTLQEEMSTDYSSTKLAGFIKKMSEKCNVIICHLW